MKQHVVERILSRERQNRLPPLFTVMFDATGAATHVKLEGATSYLYERAQQLAPEIAPHIRLLPADTTSVRRR